MFKVFGKLPEGKSLERIRKSRAWDGKQFQNVVETPMMAADANYGQLFYKFFFAQIPERMPARPLPFVRENLAKPVTEPSIAWLGHSSYLLFLNGRTILVDPVLSGYASPVKLGGVKVFPYQAQYQTEDLPAIDLLLLTHDHFDHLDYETIVKLTPKIRQVIAPLGVAAHLVYWGVNPDIITEMDWWEEKSILDGMQLTAAPSRHFSGRTFNRFKSLWCSYVLRGSGLTLYLGGDSGYSPTFAELGARFGGFDLVLLECGQYDRMWPHIHMTPELTVQAALDLRARKLMPVHWGKFALANHPWKEPIERVTRRADECNMELFLPLPGKVTPLTSQTRENWWE